MHISINIALCAYNLTTSRTCIPTLTYPSLGHYGPAGAPYLQGPPRTLPPAKHVYPLFWVLLGCFGYLYWHVLGTFGLFWVLLGYFGYLYWHVLGTFGLFSFFGGCLW